MQTVRELKGQDRFLISAIALVMLTCAMPSRAWSASKSLWVAYSQGGGIESYSTKQLKKSGMPTPIEISTYEDATGVAFDASGNLWAVVNQNDIVEFTAAQLKDLKSDPSPTPVVSSPLQPGLKVSSAAPSTPRVTCGWRMPTAT